MTYDIAKYPFLINGSGVTSKELVDQAGMIDGDFAKTFYRTTSRAARILKDEGFDVSENPPRPRDCGTARSWHTRGRNQAIRCQWNEA